MLETMRKGSNITKELFFRINSGDTEALKGYIQYRFNKGYTHQEILKNLQEKVKIPGFEDNTHWKSHMVDQILNDEAITEQAPTGYKPKTGCVRSQLGVEKFAKTRKGKARKIVKRPVHYKKHDESSSGSEPDTTVPRCSSRPRRNLANKSYQALFGQGSTLEQSSGSEDEYDPEMELSPKLKSASRKRKRDAQRVSGSKIKRRK